jgi:hypothetical protein
VKSESEWHKSIWFCFYFSNCWLLSLNSTLLPFQVWVSLCSDNTSIWIQCFSQIQEVPQLYCCLGLELSSLVSTLRFVVSWTEAEVMKEWHLDRNVWLLQSTETLSHKWHCRWILLTSPPKSLFYETKFFLCLCIL